MSKVFVLGLSILFAWTNVLTASAEKAQGKLSLQECIDIALENNRKCTASKFAVQIAQAQHKQTLSAYWPQVLLKSSYTYMDEDPVFIFPAKTINSVNTAYITAWKGGPVVAGPIYSNVSSDVPEDRVKIANRSTTFASLGLTYPLYTGGLRSAIAKQAKSGLNAAKEEARRTDLEVVYDVKRMYYACILARNLHRIGKDALARLETTLALTENLYKKGSGKVKKTDYLRNKTIVEAVRSAVAFLESNEQIAKAALINSMGLVWDAAVEPFDAEIPFNPYQADLKELVSSSYQFSPDWAKLKAGLEAVEAQIDEAKSGYFPKIAITGNLNRIYNPYDYGVASGTNEKSWAVGVGMELPIFDGFLTQNKVKEARARLAKLEQEKILLKEGMALQIKHIFLRMVGAQKQQKANEEAAVTAQENRELNIRAYQDELVETQDVIEAQIMESFMKAQYQKSLYDHAQAQAHLDFVVGEQIKKVLLEEK